jgi:hypothetical protein
MPLMLSPPGDHPRYQEAIIRAVLPAQESDDPDAFLLTRKPMTARADFPANIQRPQSWLRVPALGPPKVTLVVLDEKLPPPTA